MATILEIDSTLTERYQTTVPETVRHALKLQKRDKIHYSILPDGSVLITRAVPTKNVDPVLGRFLDFLTKDIEAHPERLKAVDAGLVQRLHSLVDGVEFDIDAALSGGE